MRVTVPTRGSMNLKANVGFVLKSDLQVMLSARISTQEYPYVEIYVSGSKDLILIRFFFGFIFRSLVLFSLLQTMTINGVSAVIKFQKA